MKVTDWVYYDDAKYEEVPDELFDEAYQAVVDDMRKHNYHFSGDYHQYGDYGAPVLDGIFKLCVTQRRWGRLMADAYPEEFQNPDDKFNYLRWYLGVYKKNDDGEYIWDKKGTTYPKKYE